MATRRPYVLSMLLTALVSCVAGIVAIAPPDGTVDAAPRCRINRTLAHESWGEQVLCVERQLLHHGFLSSYIDIYFGTTTRSAVQNFQSSRGLRATGVVDRPTAEALDIWAARARRTDRPIESRRLGTSVNGHDIWAHRFGTPGGKVVVATGQIHGNEPGGPMIAAYLRNVGAPRNVDMWVIDTVNPDGWRARSRTNARGVDLNRNFAALNWVRTTPGTPTYSGPYAASEPETRAVQRLLAEIRPKLMIVWHQTGRHVDDNRSVSNYALLRRYSALTGFPIRPTGSCTRCGGSMTSFVNNRIAGSTAFTVEMPATFSYSTARQHARAFLDLATMADGGLHG